MQEDIAEIISWNIFQMDGFKYVVPMSCKNEMRIVRGALTLFGRESNKIDTKECLGCEKDDFLKHNGKYVNVRDWSEGKVIRFSKIFRE